jgi:hypothetical protein
MDGPSVNHAIPTWNVDLHGLAEAKPALGGFVSTMLKVQAGRMGNPIRAHVVPSGATLPYSQDLWSYLEESCL